ncbi:MAG: hypothetical protein RL559_1741 [Pseudomonadota bacterium]|jgi:hypothetical protein
MTEAPSTGRPQLRVAVLMRREAVQGPMARWQPWRWTLAEVVPHEAGFGTTPRCLREGEDGALWLHPDWTVELFTDDAEGYWLNATSPTPAYFVMWRLSEPEDGSEPQAVPQAVSLSYHDAGRWLDAQETVETAAAEPEVVQWLQAFAEQHFVPEPKKRQRPQSFQRLTDRFGQPVSISTEGKRPSGPRKDTA